MSSLILSLLLVAAAAAKPEPTAEQQAVYKALSGRHESLSCTELDAMSSDPLGTYLYLIEHATQPAWVGMRAARCVMLNHAEAARPQLERWVVEPELRGLGLLLVGQIDELPLPLAKELAVKAMYEGPDPDGMRKRIARARTPEIAALAAPAATTP